MASLTLTVAYSNQRTPVSALMCPRAPLLLDTASTCTSKSAIANRISQTEKVQKKNFYENEKMKKFFQKFLKRSLEFIRWAAHESDCYVWSAGCQVPEANWASDTALYLNRRSELVLRVQDLRLGWLIQFQSLPKENTYQQCDCVHWRLLISFNFCNMLKRISLFFCCCLNGQFGKGVAL